jgi:hypothetical protein
MIACDVCAYIPGPGEAPVLPDRDGCNRCLQCWIGYRGGVEWIVSPGRLVDWRSGLVYVRADPVEEG